MRTQGGGGKKTVKFCGRPLWMAPRETKIVLLMVLRTSVNNE